MTLQSTINDSIDDHSNQNFAKSDPKSDQLIATHTSDGKKRKITDTDITKGNYPHKLLAKREIPAIIPTFVPPVNQKTADGVATSVRVLHEVRAVLRKEIVTEAICSTAGVLKDTLVVN